MSLDKAIKHRKERRQEHRGSARFDRSCRPHGGCPWCERARTISRRRLAATLALALAGCGGDTRDDDRAGIEPVDCKTNPEKCR
jgi:hypothetical protein